MTGTSSMDGHCSNDTHPSISTEDYTFITKDEYDSINEHSLYVEKDDEIQTVIQGNRIVDLNYILSWALPLQKKHNQICTQGTLFPIREENRGMGLVSIIILGCDTCEKQYKYSTEKPSLNESIINTGAVWGTLATGSTYGHLLELLSVLDVPPIPYHLFSSIENRLTTLWDQQLTEQMLTAGKEERQIAVDKGHVDDDGVPWITVYLDGGWSKRSYGHSYNAASGVGVIIGKQTGKVLFVSVRNKYCCICARAENKNIPAKEHLCYKNWTNSSSAMEADIMVEGFSHSEEIHGIRYLEFIADGDASVYARLKEKVRYGRKIRKIECRNHVLKNVTKALCNLRKDSSISKDGRKLLTVKKIKEIEKTLQKVIYENSLHREVSNLCDDFSNVTLHVFGKHTNCKEYYCTKVGESDSDDVEQLKATAMYNHIMGTMDPLFKKSSRLVDNETNNRAEVFMQIVARFNCGKRLNLIQRGSFQRRATLAGLRYNEGVDWHYKPWKTFLHQSPGTNYKAYIQREAKSAEQRRVKRKLFHDSDVRKKPQGDKKVNTDYGPNAKEAELEPIEMETECQRILEKLQVSSEEQIEIANNTIGQFGNPLYEAERRDRLTASNFGRIVKKRTWTPCHNLVKSILYPKIFYSEAVEFGKRREKVAIDMFSKLYDLEVLPAGLFVDVNYGFLAASPDGLVGTTHVVEVKCLFKTHKSGKTLEEAAKSDSSLCLTIIDGQLRLKRQHHYFYQIQGQLNICNKEACYFIVYCNDDMPLHVEIIQKDEDLWRNEMLPALCKFYKECILVEIIRGNIRLNKKCKNPPYILKAIEERENMLLYKELQKIEENLN